MPGVDVDGDDDDDDFQNPSQAIAFSQSVISSSLKNSRAQVLKLSNGCRSRKRATSTTAIGKENEIVTKKQCAVSRVFSDAEKVVPVITKRKVLYHNDCPGSVRNSTVVGCSAGNEIEYRKSNLVATGALNLGLNLLQFERTTRSGSQYLGSEETSTLKSVVSDSSNVDLDCSDVCMDSVELDNKTRGYYLEKSVVMSVTASADGGNDYNETQSRRTCLASTELIHPEDWPKRNAGNQIPNHFVDQNMLEDDGGISSEAMLLEFKKKLLSRSNGCNEIKPSRQIEESKVSEKGPMGEMQSFITRDCEPVLMDRIKQQNYTMSIEAKLLDPVKKLLPCTTRGEILEVGVCEEFEPGTQLKMLMGLCCEMDDQGCSGSGKVSPERIDSGIQLNAIETNLLVECPLCGTDITKLSEEMRQMHTNECLDKDNTNEVSVTISQATPNACQQLVDKNFILEWLRALNLCQYEEVFRREEIDWDTLKWLTEEDLISIGIVSLGPRKKIVHALNKLRQRNSLTPNGESASFIVAANEKKKIALPGNKLITEYFSGPVQYKVRGSFPSKLFYNAKEASKDPIQKRVGSRRAANRGRQRDIPPWCCISGTPFRVDAFRYLRGDCSHWFLTHFHMDHYQGLTKNFCNGKIYCSKITAHLVNMKIGIPWDRIQILPLNEKIIIAGINLTCLDANHCPGSIIILFEPPNNKAILHTGDFRFSDEMAGSSLLQSSHIHTLILDTTYCNPQYDFPKQDEVIQFVIDAIQAEAFNPKTLFLIGTYTIGKERLFLEVARTLKKKVYVGFGKLNLLKCLDLPEEDMQLFTENEMESHIHVVPMWTIASFKRMRHISDQNMGRYNLIVAFSPTGWTFGKGKKKTPGRRWQQGTVIRYEVPYSEHCSFTELRDFVKFMSPENIIPSVNNDGPESVDAMLALLSSDS